MAVNEQKSDQETNNNKDTWIVIPAFNEEAKIGEILNNLCKLRYSIIIIDDCSIDATSNIALNYPVVLLRHRVNLGQGASLQTGFDYVLQKTKAKYVITFDSDGQHNIDDIPAILEPLTTANYDVVLGSRFLDKRYKSSRESGIPPLKLVTLKIGVIFTRVTTGLNVTDTHNGFRAFRVEILKGINLTQDRMAHGSEILAIISKKKLRFCEVPVRVAYTEYSKKKGQSIFNAINIIWDLFFGREE